MDLTPPHIDPPERGPEALPAPDHEAPPQAPAEAAADVAAAATAAATATATATAEGTAEGTATNREHRPRIGPEIGGRRFRVGNADEYVPFRNRTKRRRRFIAATAGVVVLLGAAGYGVLTLADSGSSAKPTAACPAKANEAAVKADNSGAALLNAAQITLNVYNSTDRQGLAASTATLLKQRGFVIGKVANDPLDAHLTAAAQIRGSAQETTSMHVVAAEVSGAQFSTDQRTDPSVDLVLGSAFNGLSTPNQVAAALASKTTAVGHAKSGVSCS